MRTARVLPLLILILFAIPGGGCITAKPILRLSPRAPETEIAWLGGVPIVGKAGQHSRVAVAFAHEQDGRLGLRVEVENRSEQTLLLDSRNFSYRICHWVQGKGETCGPRTYVADPEAAIDAMDIQRRRDQAANENAEAFHTVMGLLSVTGQLASVASGNHRSATQFGLGANFSLNQANALAAREQHQSTAYALARSNWELGAFRKTTTPPGRAVAGLVYVPQDPSASAIMLYAHVDDELYTFPFNQTVLHPNRSPAPRRQPRRTRNANRRRRIPKSSW